MRKYRISWKSYYDNVGELHKIEDFSDVQFKNYGIRVTNDDTNKTYIIPYTSIYDIEIIEED